MASSEEYLASLGLDFSDADRAVNSTISILGHLGAAFPEVAKQASKAEVALVGVGKAAKTSATSTDVNSAAQNRSATATRKNTDNLISQRYALYDVATTYGVVSAALLAADGYAIKVGADFESSFTNVQRTSNASVGALGQIKNELTDLSTQIPLTFDQITKIATLGNQLGIDSSGLVSFTKNVAQFSAVTGIAVEQVALDFGTLGNLLQIGSDQYQNLGSSIALAGRNAAATEQQITAVAGQIASYTQLAGFSADQTIGLATALASLKVPPEQARSAIQALFTTLNSATAEGGQKLQNFATVLGLTVEQTRELIKNNPSAFVEQFAKSLNSLDSEQLTQTLDVLGLSEKRIATVLTKLSSDQALKELSNDLANAALGFGQGTELARQYALIADDLNTKFMELVNSLNALIASVSGGAVPGLAAFVGQVILAINAIRGFMSNEDAQRVVIFVGLLGGLVGVVFAFRAATALATASTYALTTAQAGLAASGSAGGIRGLLTAMLGYRTAAVQATTATTVFSSAAGASIVPVTGAATATSKLATGLKLVGKATIVFGLLQFGVGLLTDFRGTMIDAADSIYGLVFAAAGASSAVRDLLQNFVNFLGVFGGPGQAILDAAAGFDAGVLNAIKGLQGWANNLPTSQTDDFSGSVGDLSAGIDSTDLDGFASGLDDVGGSAGGAADEVRTLVDYANDLSGIFSRSFDLRFGSGQALDTITSQWSAIKQAIADTNQQIAEYQAKMQSLSADKAVREYWLQVAENYGDALRAGVLRGEIADIDNDLAKTAADLTKAQQKNSKTLVGNSDAAIENRSEILGLVKSYQDYLTSLASSGLSQDELAAKTAQLKAQFLAQAQGLGYSVAQLGTYAAAFDDVSTAISLVPRNITVTGNVNPALQAIAELQAKLKSLGGQSYAGPTILNPTNSKEIRRMALEAAIAARSAYVGLLISQKNYSGADAASSSLDTMRYNLASGNYRSGGWTGNGAPWEVAGLVHGQEFVLNQTGAQMFPRQVLEAANQGRAPRFAGSPSGSPSGGGSGVMDLGSQTLRLFDEWFRSIYLHVGDAEVGQATDRYHERVRSSGG